MIKVTTKTKTVKVITIEVDQDVAILVRGAINAAGDGGIDPFTPSERAKLVELDANLLEAGVT